MSQFEAFLTLIIFFEDIDSACWNDNLDDNGRNEPTVGSTAPSRNGSKKSAKNAVEVNESPPEDFTSDSAVTKKRRSRKLSDGPGKQSQAKMRRDIVESSDDEVTGIQTKNGQSNDDKLTADGASMFNRSSISPSKPSTETPSAPSSPMEANSKVARKRKAVTPKERKTPNAKRPAVRKETCSESSTAPQSTFGRGLVPKKGSASASKKSVSKAANNSIVELDDIDDENSMSRRSDNCVENKIGRAHV